MLLDAHHILCTYVLNHLHSSHLTFYHYHTHSSLCLHLLFSCYCSLLLFVYCVWIHISRTTHTHTQLHSFIIPHFLLIALVGKGRLCFRSRLELNSHSRNMFMCVFILCLCRSRPLIFASRTLIDCKCASSSTYFFF